VVQRPAATGLAGLASCQVETVILARHAESVFSVRARMNGDPAVAGPLTGRGVAQAERLGEALREEPVDLCVVTEFERTRKTADITLKGREVPRLVVPELNDINVGKFEGGPLETYLAWARTASPLDVPEGGESRAAAAARVARGYRIVLERHEEHVLVIAHGLPIRYLLLAVAGEGPRPVLGKVDYATPYKLTRQEVLEAVDDLERWAGAPSWDRDQG
jgi:broad specificity phosphatase PhoE